MVTVGPQFPVYQFNLQCVQIYTSEFVQIRKLSNKTLYSSTEFYKFRIVPKYKDRYILIKQSIRNKPVLRKLKYLQNVNGHQLTSVAQHLVAIWKPYNVQKPIRLQVLGILGA